MLVKTDTKNTHFLSDLGYKILSGVVATASVLSIFSGFTTPVMANDTGSLTATSSGNTSGHNINTISTSSLCTDGSKLTGKDAEVFSKLTPHTDGDIVCAKSDGFKTEITGTNSVKNYHWTAWYKNTADEKPDITKDTGNYNGFNKIKVDQWKQYRAEVEGLNGGRFPQDKDYTYPVDTSEDKLDFWGDIAGYYSVLGDPQYSSIHLTAYQQFSYKTKHVEYRYVKITPPPVIYDNDDVYTPQYGNANYGNANTTKNNKTNNKTPGKKQKKNTTHVYKETNTRYYPGGSALNFNSCDAMNNMFAGRLCQGLTGTTKKSLYTYQNSNSLSINSNELLGQVIKTEYSKNNYEGVVTMGYDQYEKYADYTYSYETQTVKVAEADLSSGTYATEFAAMPKISLTSGSASDMSISTTNTGFWESTTPRYWTNHGTSTISNTSSLPYHFESESTAGSGVNTINIYASIQQKDKLYTLVHGYPNITEVKIPGVPAIPGFPPDQDETCAEVGNNDVCSKKETPPIGIEVKLTDDNPQGYEEVDKKIHLVKNQETQDDIRNSKQ